MSLKRVWIPSPNYSSRGGTAVRLIVLHTAEGALTYQSLGSFFANPASGVSSQVGIDSTPGTIGEYLTRSAKPWTQGAANPYSVSAELCAFAAWTANDWMAHPVMLSNTAQWLAEEAQALGLPLVRLSASQAQDGHSRGVCQHVDLGQAGGGHWDCGPSFPMDDVIAMAISGSSPPAEIQPPGGEDMFIQEPDDTVYQLIYAGKDSYWRSIPAPQAAKLPTGVVVKDDGGWLRLWKVGAT